MVNEHLGKALVDIVVFLEFSDVEVVDADAAVSAMERFAYELKFLPEGDKSDLIQCWERVAEAYGERAQFVRTLPDVLGIR